MGRPNSTRAMDEFDHWVITIQEEYLDERGGLRGLHAQQHCLQEFGKDWQDSFARFAHEMNDKIANYQSPRLFLAL
jgi:hypothetical protein